MCNMTLQDRPGPLQRSRNEMFDESGPGIQGLE
jgi:hypothetical protein